MIHLLGSDILFPTAVRAVGVLKLVKLSTWPLISFNLVLRIALVAKLVLSGLQYLI